MVLPALTALSGCKLTLLAMIMTASMSAASEQHISQWIQETPAEYTGSKTVQLSWQDCSGGKMHVKDVDVKFNGGKPVTLGQTLNVAASGNRRGRHWWRIHVFSQGRHHSG